MNATVTFIPAQLNIDIAPLNIDVSTGTPVAREYVGGEPYEGEYTITPSNETQVLVTRHKLLTENLTINPIPSNYGLITWNGSVLTIS